MIVSPRRPQRILTAHMFDSETITWTPAPGEAAQVTVFSALYTAPDAEATGTLLVQVAGINVFEQTQSGVLGFPTIIGAPLWMLHDTETVSAQVSATLGATWDIFICGEVWAKYGPIT